MAWVATLNRLLSIPGNSTCVDCGTPDPEWASINLGIVMCLNCSGIHRQLGVHVTKIRSIKLDDCWSVAMLEYMESIGNEAFNRVWQCRLQKNVLRPENFPGLMLIREIFIRRKYLYKEFADNFVTTTPSPALIATIQESKIYDAPHQYVKSVGSSDDDSFISLGSPTAAGNSLLNGSQTPAPPVSGFVEKLSGKKAQLFKRWQRRFMRIDSIGILSYYVDDVTRECQGTVNLRDVNVMMQDDSESGKPFSFCITTKKGGEHAGRTFSFYCLNDAERFSWVEAIQKFSLVAPIFSPKAIRQRSEGPRSVSGPSLMDQMRLLSRNIWQCPSNDCDASISKVSFLDEWTRTVSAMKSGTARRRQGLFGEYCVWEDIHLVLTQQNIYCLPNSLLDDFCLWLALPRDSDLPVIFSSEIVAMPLRYCNVDDHCDPESKFPNPITNYNRNQSTGACFTVWSPLIIWVFNCDDAAKVSWSRAIKEAITVANGQATK